MPQLFDDIERGIPWWRGDWFNLGEDVFPEQMSQALDDVNVNTLKVYAWVARQIPPSRRIFNLSWTHYREVAELTPEQQDEWLTRALAGSEGKRWSSARLRRELNASKAQKSGHTLAHYVLVSCTTVEDQENFVTRMQAEGRIAKAVDRAHDATVQIAGEGQTDDAAKAKKAKKAKKGEGNDTQEVAQSA